MGRALSTSASRVLSHLSAVIPVKPPALPSLAQIPSMMAEDRRYATNGWKTFNGYGSKTPFLIGVSGGTASGKSTVCSRIMEKLGQDEIDHRQRQVVCISQDSFYRELNPSRNLKRPKAYSILTIQMHLTINFYKKLLKIFWKEECAKFLYMISKLILGERMNLLPFTRLMFSSLKGSWFSILLKYETSFI